MSTRAWIVWAVAVAAAAGCGGAVASTVSAPRSPSLARWTAFSHARTPIDVAMGRSDGRPVVTADGRLFVLGASGRLTRFAPAYHVSAGLEAYIALPAASHRGCSFGRNAVYAIRLQNGRGITRVSPTGAVGKFAGIAAPGLINGIAFDERGAFGYRLLVTINHGATTTVDAVDCHGRVATLTTSAPRVEGGIAVAPATFGRFAGDLIAPDELSGKIFAITPRGRSLLVADSGLPHGQDFGVESETFVPASPRAQLLVADRLAPGNPHPGDDVLLRVSYRVLHAAGVRASDLLVSGEGGAFTDAIRCGPVRCSVRYVANGPSEAHVEGHIGFIGG
jgi:hypothetical protein